MDETAPGVTYTPPPDMNPAALAATFHAHSNLAQTAGPLDDISAFGSIGKLLLQLRVLFIRKNLLDVLRKDGCLKEDHGRNDRSVTHVCQ